MVRRRRRLVVRRGRKRYRRFNRKVFRTDSYQFTPSWNPRVCVDKGCAWQKRAVSWTGQSGTGSNTYVIAAKDIFDQLIPDGFTKNQTTTSLGFMYLPIKIRYVIVYCPSLVQHADITVRPSVNILLWQSGEEPRQYESTNGFGRCASIGFKVPPICRRPLTIKKTGQEAIATIGFNVNDTSYKIVVGLMYQF